MSHKELSIRKFGSFHVTDTSETAIIKLVTDMTTGNVELKQMFYLLQFNISSQFHWNFNTPVIILQNYLHSL